MKVGLQKKELKRKILLTIIIIFAFFIVSSLIFTVVSIDSRSKKEMKEFEVREKQRVDQNLQNYVYIAYTVMNNNYLNASDIKYLPKSYGLKLKSMMEIAESIVNENLKYGSEGKRRAKEALEGLRFDKGMGYYFIIENEFPEPKMILEPLFPKLNGKTLNDPAFNTANGTTRNIFIACVNECRDSTKDGFVNYTWPKPSLNPKDTNKVEIPKFTYVKLFEEWNWIIGTGVYLDEAVKDAMAKSKEDLRNIRYDNGTGYFWINDDINPVPRLIMNAVAPQIEGKILTGKKFNRAFDTDENLYVAFLRKSKEGTGGYVNYKWDKPTQTKEIIENAPKQSYVKFFSPFGWVIGSGVYIDDIDTELNKRKAAMDSERGSTILIYLLISISIAVISILILILTMNKTFRGNDNDDEKEIESDELIPEQINTTTAVTTPTTPTQPSASHTDSLESASKLLKIFLSEQTKLLAYNKTLEQSLQKDNTDDVKSLASEIHQLTDEIRRNLIDVNNALKGKDSELSGYNQADMQIEETKTEEQIRKDNEEKDSNLGLKFTPF